MTSATLAPSSRLTRLRHAARGPKRSIWPWFFLAPFLCLFSLFLLYPIVDTLILSFQEKNGLGQGQWVGLTNYRELLDDPRFHTAVHNTLLLLAGSLFILVPCSFALALALNSRRLRLRAIHRVVFLLPAASSAVVAAMIFLVLYEDQYGVFNSMLGSVGVARVGWLTAPTFVLPSIFILTLWKWTGYNSLYFLAGLQTIPDELLEAARVDGASFRQQLRYVYWPMLKPITSVVVVLVIIGTSQLFAEPWLLTRGTGGPDQAGLTTAMLAYQVAFREIRYGYGAAVAYMTVLGVVAASLVALALLRSKEP